jgi:hypothetical protein
MSCYWRYSQAQDQDQAQAQAQAQAQDQDQNQRTVFKEIGNVHIDIDNENISVAILAILAFFLGALDGPGVQALLDKYTK